MVLTHFGVISILTATIFPRLTLKIRTKLTQGDYTKVVDLPTLYNCYKGLMLFCSKHFAETACQVGVPLGFGEQ
jgi:hypothetical protein